MQTHEDFSHDNSFIQRLRERADEMSKAQASQITAGKKDEVPLAKWKHLGMHVTHMPNDEQGITRISIGGMENMSGDYCVIRGGVGRCIQMLEQALAALRKAP